MCSGACSLEMARRPKAGGLLYDPGDTLEALESTRFAIYSAWSSISVLRVALCRPGSPETKENIRKQLADQSAELQLLYAKERALVLKQLDDMQITGDTMYDSCMPLPVFCSSVCD